ncbi:D-2-hydroxyacid dehydrogenase [Pseudomonas lalucatii]|uniref:D-2-hydroxyacid dehydrogenase n=1 Tax=Pseudomonas lalucatii TaxID=1424203 RepID=A0ABS5PY64_9PSED|nr:D-2-hydroxyacid dehydrogenase [Pseudomonas lalucatii]MBS7661314.1 D-2-hydroxyacid dehydrogenase [Pseudomonas lalucatii]QVM87832.1 D-2-hydroxyacid dehydrogenase [Pseudomonas lalucatii]
MHLLIAEGAHTTYAELLRQAAPELELRGSADPAELARWADGCPLWLGQPDLLAALLAAGHRPQWLQSTWAGITPLLAPELPRDYRLSRAVGIFGQVMAEYVLGHLLAHERRLFARQAAQAEQRWDSSLPRSLAGRRVLIVGCGDIGQSVAQFLAPFGVELFGVASQARELAPFVAVAGMEALPRLAADADYLVNLLPDTPATRDVYDAALLGRLKPSAVLINAGRGAAVVDADLVAALQRGRLAGAVIDVCRQEPLPAGHPFWTAPRLLLTGHSSAPTDPRLMARLFLDNLKRWRGGQALRGQVDFIRGY